MPLSLGSRMFQCRACGMVCRMNPYLYMRWSLIPLAVILASMVLVAFSLFLYFVLIVLVIRIIWVFVAPRMVPLECLRPRQIPKSSD